MWRENSYPYKLKNLLNQNNIGKTFQVINKGMISKTSKDILEQLPENLNKYKPHIVVAMIGINDQDEEISDVKLPDFIDDSNEEFSELNESHQNEENSESTIYKQLPFKKMRVYKFYNLLVKHIKAKLHEKEKLAVLNVEQKVEKKDYVGDYEENLIQPMDLEPEKFKIAALAQLAKLNTQFNQRQEKWKEAISPEKESISQQLQSIMIQKASLYVNMGKYFAKAEPQQAEIFFLKALELFPNHGMINEELALFYAEFYPVKFPAFFIRTLDLVKDDADKRIKIILHFADFYISKGKTDIAYKLIKNVFALMPAAKGQTLFLVGSWFEKNGYVQEAEKIYQEANKNEPFYAFTKITITK